GGAGRTPPGLPCTCSLPHGLATRKRNHAPWEVVSAGLVRGRTLTSYHTIQDDIRNAGGNWVDREVVQGGNWVTSRQRGDLPAFNRAVIALFSQSLVPGRR